MFSSRKLSKFKNFFLDCLLVVRFFLFIFSFYRTLNVGIKGQKFKKF